MLVPVNIVDSYIIDNTEVSKNTFINELKKYIQNKYKNLNIDITDEELNYWANKYLKILNDNKIHLFDCHLFQINKIRLYN